MRYVAAALFALIALTSCAHRTKYQFATNWKYTAPPPTPSPTPMKGERAVTISNLPGEQGPVTTRVNLSPQFQIQPARPIQNARLMWSVSIAPSPAPPKFASPRIIPWRDLVYVSAGTDLTAVNAANGTGKWHRNDVGTPFAVSEAMVIASSANRVYALMRETGARVWRRSACSEATEVADLAIDGEMVLVLCRRDAALVGMDLYTGRVRYRRTLHESDVGYELQILRPGSVLANASFSGAWSGNNNYLLRSRDGVVLFKKTDLEVLQVRDDNVEFNNECCFDRISAYEPAILFWVNLVSGEESPQTILAPERGRFTRFGGEPTNGGFGTVFPIGAFTYLSYGEMLYRYSSLSTDSPEALLDDFEHVYYAHGSIVIALLYGYPSPIAARIDFSKRPYKVRPLVAAPWPFAGYVDREPGARSSALTASFFDNGRFAIAGGSVGRISPTCYSKAVQVWQGAVAVVCFSNDRPQLRLYSVND